MTKDDLQARVDALKFYHRIELPHGIVTPGPMPINLEFYKLPEDFTGKSVLDVGAYDGFFTFEALKRGADDVWAIDNFSDAIYEGEQRSWAQFDLCRDALGYTRRCSRTETDLYSLKDWEDRYDVILYLGCLYHARHPLLALDILRSLLAPGGQIFVESHICDHYSPYKAGGRGDEMIMEFFPDGQLAGCATNWWAPTLRTMMNMMRVAGFNNVEGWKIDDPGESVYSRGFARGTA